ncbi:MAG: hypothetical protein Q6362_001570 [Candidatus Wukongarchaeota archaeon]|nr:hypothetical protein [Candidatus Wukongarchaeota archaeon]MDO8128123.1 hypothetical protein [Candidatus Wukongarchaeota archaeon]
MSERGGMRAASLKHLIFYIPMKQALGLHTLGTGLSCACRSYKWK